MSTEKRILSFSKYKKSLSIDVFDATMFQCNKLVSEIWNYFFHYYKIL